MNTARINGAELEYEDTGTGEPVVCIHGVLIADTFRPLSRDANLQGRYRFIIYHRRGYAGSSPRSGTVSIARESADCRELLAHLGIERAHVAGHSSGGIIAAQLALDAPGLVQTLALLEPAMMVGQSGPGYRSAMQQGIERFRNAADPAQLVDQFLQARWPGYRDPLERILPGAFAQAVTDARTAFEGEMPEVIEWRFGESVAKRIGQPTLSLLGGESGNSSPRFEETHRLLLDWLPNAEGFVMPGVAHLMLVQDPAGMAEALAAFWERHPLTV